MHMNERKSLLSSKHILHERGMKKMPIKVSHTSLMFNNIMEEIKMLLMDSTTIHPGFHISGIPQLSEHGDSIGQTKEYNGVYSRKNHE